MSRVRALDRETDVLYEALHAAAERNRELERMVETLEWALQAAGAIATAGLGVAHSIAREMGYPPPNPLNDPPGLDACPRCRDREVHTLLECVQLRAGGAL